MPYKLREEVLNVLLAGLLESRGLLSVPETITKGLSSQAKKLPDIVIADLWGIRIVIEGRFANGATVKSGLLNDARNRVLQGVSPICLAVLYPPKLRTAASVPVARKALANATFEVCVISEQGDGEWGDSDVDGLTEILRHSYELIIAENVVIDAAERINSAIETSAALIAATPASPTRLRGILGIPEDASWAIDGDQGEDEDEE